ncbi:alpha/beta hydrolase-fold protein [Brevibacillus laterosporus]|uniref:Alpha/beta hydrolase-fold protein n=1 Tax=Brevibacillus halotolerans TaxID=1507437 RepID=A0ABT4HT33_9BACL|nr:MULTISPECIES: alpha/beta hydrolase-fold protein [Brevibacillus]MCR8984229.1 alpha/beta hydrolase-fold protein [Brevibacillus laterosporus]MCZ0829950.1 alpha/beta hydrolase-fold protein [Brevibacillus halotolerans]
MREVFVTETVGDREIMIYLPPTYEAGGSFPVVYVQDGSYLVHTCMNLLEHLFITKELPEMIFVCIPPHNRNDEYTPWPAKALLSSYPDFGGKGAEYLSYVVHTLKPHVDSVYRTKAEAEHTGIIGGSFGGMISLYAAYLYPEVFGRIGLLSASLWFEGLLDFIRDNQIGSSKQRMYMYVGSLEGIYKKNIQANMVEYTYKAHEFLIGNGFPKEQLKLVVEEGGTHDGLFFIKHFPQAMKWLFTS